VTLKRFRWSLPLTGLPDGIFSNQKSHFVAIWYILRLCGIFFPFRCVVPRTIWQHYVCSHWWNFCLRISGDGNVWRDPEIATRQEAGHNGKTDPIALLTLHHNGVNAVNRLNLLRSFVKKEIKVMLCVCFVLN
jgi:hypothetical protein